MPDFFKVVLQSNANGQTMNNILYWSVFGEGSVSFDPPQMERLATEVIDSVLPLIRAVQPSGVTYQQVEVTTVNEYNITTSPYAVVVDTSVTGNIPVTYDTPAGVFILAFRVVPPVGIPGIAIMRRSYIAIGPTVNSVVEPNGQVSTLAAERAALEAGMVLPITTAEEVFVPMRVGRRVAPAPAAYGTISAAIFRPFTSFRRSRLFKPTGSQ